jgi:hypothetical protein
MDEPDLREASRWSRARSSGDCVVASARSVDDLSLPAVVTGTRTSALIIYGMIRGRAVYPLRAARTNRISTPSGCSAIRRWNTAP